MNRDFVKVDIYFLFSLFINQSLYRNLENCVLRISFPRSNLEGLYIMSARKTNILTLEKFESTLSTCCSFLQ